MGDRSFIWRPRDVLTYGSVAPPITIAVSVYAISGASGETPTVMITSLSCPVLPMLVWMVSPQR